MPRTRRRKFPQRRGGSSKTAVAPTQNTYEGTTECEVAEGFKDGAEDNAASNAFNGQGIAQLASYATKAVSAEVMKPKEMFEKAEFDDPVEKCQFDQKSIMGIPPVYSGFAFDIDVYQYNVRVYDVYYQDLQHAHMALTLKFSKITRLIKSSNKNFVLEMYTDNYNFQQLMKNLLLSTIFQRNEVSIEIDRHRSRDFTKDSKVGKVTEPVQYSEQFNRVTFNTYNAFARKFLSSCQVDGTTTLHTGARRLRSLFLNNLPSCMNKRFIQLLFPCSLNVSIRELSRECRSAVLLMKNKETAYNHLLAFTKLKVDGREIQMSTSRVKQEEALKNFSENHTSKILVYKKKNNPKHQKKDVPEAQSTGNGKKKALEKVSSSLLENGEEKSSKKSDKNNDEKMSDGKKKNGKSMQSNSARDHAPGSSRKDNKRSRRKNGNEKRRRQQEWRAEQWNREQALLREQRSHYLKVEHMRELELQREMIHEREQKMIEAQMELQRQSETALLQRDIESVQRLELQRQQEMEVAQQMEWQRLREIEISQQMERQRQREIDISQQRECQWQREIGISQELELERHQEIEQGQQQEMEQLRLGQEREIQRQRELQGRQEAAHKLMGIEQEEHRRRQRPSIPTHRGRKRARNTERAQKWRQRWELKRRAEESLERGGPSELECMQELELERNRACLLMDQQGIWKPQMSREEEHQVPFKRSRYSTYTEAAGDYQGYIDSSHPQQRFGGSSQRWNETQRNVGHPGQNPQGDVLQQNLTSGLREPDFGSLMNQYDQDAQPVQVTRMEQMRGRQRFSSAQQEESWSQGQRFHQHSMGEYSGYEAGY